jgi:hypothetical protein
LEEKFATDVALVTPFGDCDRFDFVVAIAHLAMSFALLLVLPCAVSQRHFLSPFAQLFVLGIAPPYARAFAWSRVRLFESGRLWFSRRVFLCVFSSIATAGWL